MAVRVNVSIKGIDSTFKNLNQETTKLINNAQRIAAFQSVADLQYTTPVDEGRARGSWLLTANNREVFDASTGSKPVTLLGPVSTTRIETLYLTNGTPYIQDLNAGSSVQAPPRFIERTVSKYFKTGGSFVRTI